MRHTATLVVFLSCLGACGGGGNDPPPGGGNPDAQVTVTPDAAPPDAGTADAREIAIDITTVHVSGVVTANGGVPDSACAGDELRATVYFYQEDGAGNFGLPVPCAAAGTPFTFEGDVFPGTYRVQVAGGVSSLPTSGINVAAGLDLHADRAGLAFDITNRHVSGTITQNGQPPTETNCPIGLDRGQVHFQEISSGDFFSFLVPCVATSGTPFVFSGTVPPGIYKVSVLGENSSLLGGTHVVDTALSVQSDLDNLSYNLVTHHVSGTITLNGGVVAPNFSSRPGSGTWEPRRPSWRCAAAAQSSPG